MKIKHHISTHVRNTIYKKKRDRFFQLGLPKQVALVSAKQRTGLEGLLEKILLQSEVLELKSNPERAAEGVVIEASVKKGLGKSEE